MATSFPERPGRSGKRRPRRHKNPSNRHDPPTRGPAKRPRQPPSDPRNCEIRCFKSPRYFDPRVEFAQMRTKRIFELPIRSPNPRDGSGKSAATPHFRRPASGARRYHRNTVRVGVIQADPAGRTPGPTHTGPLGHPAACGPAIRPRAPDPRRTARTPWPRYERSRSASPRRARARPRPSPAP